MSEWRTNRRTGKKFPIEGSKVGDSVYIASPNLAPPDICPFCGRSTVGEPRTWRNDRYCHDACLHDNAIDIVDAVGGTVTFLPPFGNKRFIVTTLDEGEVEIEAPDLEHAVAMAKLRWPDGFLEVIPVE